MEALKNKGIDLHNFVCTKLILSNVDGRIKITPVGKIIKNINPQINQSN